MLYPTELRARVSDFLYFKLLPSSNPLTSTPLLAKTVSKLYQNPSVWPDCIKALRLFIGAAIELQMRLPFHLSFHLRVLLENFRIALPQQLRYPLVGHATSGKPGRVLQAKL